MKLRQANATTTELCIGAGQRLIVITMENASNTWNSPNANRKSEIVLVYPYPPLVIRPILILTCSNIQHHTNAAPSRSISSSLMLWVVAATLPSSLLSLLMESCLAFQSYSYPVMSSAVVLRSFDLLRLVLAT